MLGFAASFFLILLAEMGDKTQLVALSFATRIKPSKVMAGIFIGTLLSHFMAVLIGQNLSLVIPFSALKMLIGLSFVGFGLWTFKGDSIEEDKRKKNPRLGPVATVAIAFFLAELGDKTQLATVSLAAEYRSFLGVWAGSTLGMVCADGLAIILGVIAGKKLPERSIRYISALIFIVFGTAIFLEALLAAARKA
jgi:Ca2+/H+ antiporter, TMEM165/GDT1 family